ncbi:MAG: glycosyltransferase [Erysipelotrichaceae bacterium]
MGESVQQKQYKLGFVILHYQIIKETIACIESIIKNIDTNNYHIVVIDNGSSNNSGQDLQTKYQNNQKIKVIINGENLGFTGGNNVGFDYAKNTMLCDFIVMCNNDTEIIQNDFFAQILKEYQKSHFAVLGPEIHLLDQTVCHYPFKILKLSEIKTDRERINKLLFKNKYFLESLELVSKKIIMKLINWQKIRHHFRSEIAVPTRGEMVRLHGCCWVFSPVYLNKFNGLEERTFFYGEEDVLFVQLVRNNLLSVYQPLVKIKHHEQAATNELISKGYKKRRYTYLQHLKTLSMLEELYQEDLASLKDYI